MINNLFEGSEVSIRALALVVTLLFTPLEVGLPAFDQFGVADLVSVWPMVLQSDLVSDIEFRLLGLIDCLEWIDRSLETSGVGQLDLVIVCPVLSLLLEEVQTLAPRSFVVGLLVSPVVLVILVTGELGELSTMDTQDLVAELLGHVLDHLLHSALLESSLIESNSIEALESESQNASLTILNSLLSIGVGFKVLAKLLLLKEVILFSFLNQDALSIDLRLIDPLD